MDGLVEVEHMKMDQACPHCGKTPAEGPAMANEFERTKAMDIARLDEIEKAMAAMGPYSMVGNYVTAGEIINVMRELKRIRHPETL
jgi:hypothetical protein